jgi:hypothetical protein
MKAPDGKWVHFGQMQYKDYTLTGDDEKRRLFRLRNHRWSANPKWSASWLAYYILWS